MTRREKLRRRWAAVVISLPIAVWAHIGAPPVGAFDEPAETSLNAPTHVMRMVAANALVAAACPDGRVRLTDLEVAQRLNERAALSVALDNAERTRREEEKLDPTSYRFADDPGEASRLAHKQYGPDSFLTRSAVTVLSIADAAERGSQAQLDRINNVTGTMVEAGRAATGWRSMPTVELRSRVRYDEAGVRMLSRW